MSALEKECADRDAQPLRRGHALSRRHLQPVHVQEVHRRAPGVRARVRHRLLRRRSRQLQVPALRPRRRLLPRLRQRQAAPRPSTTSSGRPTARSDGELVFVSGTPGRHRRGSTPSPSCEYERDVRLSVHARSGSACSCAARSTTYSKQGAEADASGRDAPVRRREQLEGATRAASRRSRTTEIIAEEGRRGEPRSRQQLASDPTKYAQASGTTSPSVEKKSAADAQALHADRAVEPRLAALFGYATTLVRRRRGAQAERRAPARVSRVGAAVAGAAAVLAGADLRRARRGAC